jgi:hypothetical protein
VLLTDDEDAETLEMILPPAPERTAKHDKSANNKSKPTATDFFILTIEPFRESAFKASVKRACLVLGRLGLAMALREVA